MVGQGKSSKPFYINRAVEQTFKTEGTEQYALSGTLDKLPTYKKARERISHPSHSSLAENYATYFGANASEFGWEYSSLYDFRHLSEIYGKVNSNVFSLYGTISGTITAGDVATGDTSGAQGEIAIGGTGGGSFITIVPFTIGEVITGGTSGGTGTITDISGDKIKYTSSSVVELVDDEVITGGTSGARAVVDTYSKTGVIADDVVVFSIKLFAEGETISTSGATSGTMAALTNVIYNHVPIISAEQFSQTNFYVNESITIAQTNLLGCVLDEITLKAVAGNELVTGNVKYLVADDQKDTSQDTEVAFSSLSAYEYTTFGVTINGVDHKDIARTFELGFSRKNSRIMTFSDDTIAGMVTNMVAPTLSFDVLRSDFTYDDIVDAGTSIPVVVTFTRGNEVTTITYSDCNIENLDITDQDNALMDKIPLIVNGVPTINIKDRLPNHHWLGPVTT